MGRALRTLKSATVTLACQVPMVDLLASRSEEEEALCAVCGGGVSVAPNFIVFCERCDVAVHQACYQIDEVPSGARLSAQARAFPILCWAAPP